MSSAPFNTESNRLPFWALSDAREAESFGFTIYVGTLSNSTGNRMPIAEIEECVAEFCNRSKLCCSVFTTRFYYVGNWEDGVGVTLINYPRFPKDLGELRSLAVSLATLLREKAKQQRVTICAHHGGSEPNRTYGSI